MQHDPPMTLKGNIVVRNLDDVVCFMVGHQEVRRSALRESVLHRLERAVSEAEGQDSDCAFRRWAEVEG